MTDEIQKPAMIPTIGREQTAMEKADWTGGEVGSLTSEKAIMRYLHDIQQEFTKKHMPFDYPCARRDCMKKLEELRDERMITRLPVTEQLEKMKLEFGDVRKKYGDPKRFVLMQEDDVMVKQVVALEGGSKGRRETTNVITAKMQKYHCKERGCRIQVEVPISEWDERNGK